MLPYLSFLKILKQTGCTTYPILDLQPLDAIVSLSLVHRWMNTEEPGRVGCGLLPSETI